MKNLLTLEIEKIVYGGRGMGRAGGKVVFVPFTAPGDCVTVRVLKEKKDYLEAALQTFANPSAKRVAPFCAVFGRCGGCQLQHLGYDDQICIKEENLQGFLRGLRQKRGFDILPTLRAPRDRGYRIRAQLKASLIDGRPALGFYEIKSHCVTPIDSCPLLHPLADEILRDFCQKTGRGKQLGKLQSMDIFVSPEEEKGILRLRGRETAGVKGLEKLVTGSPGLKGAKFEGKSEASWGDLHLRFSLPGDPDRGPLEMKVPAGSFSQVNPFQNRNLIQKVGEWAALTGREKVLDLFCGAGNLTLPIAQRAAKVWGVDVDQTAIAAAEENARKNLLKNCSFRAAPAKAGVSWALEEAKRADLVVLDPPRAGAADILEGIAKLRPQKILYVSCEPPTLVRDLTRLGELGYPVTRLQPLDMFPQTYHLETIAELQLG